MKKRICFIFILFLCLLSSSVFAASTNSLSINSDACILVEDSTGYILFEKNSKEKMYPASTTKILTALLVLEKGNLIDTVTISNTAVSSLSGGYVTPYISAGEELTVEQLLNVLLIPSGNVAGNALAEYVSGSIDNFCVLMNSRAKELGCVNSHFTNPYGLHNENHYSCAYDLYLIAKEAMKYDVFRSIVSKTSYTLAPSNKHLRDDRTLYSTNDLIKPNSSSYYEYALGIKTGYTSQAKDCLVSAATKDNMTLYAVILGAGKSDTGTSYRYNDIKKLFNYGFNNYLFRTLRSKDSVVQTVEVADATSDTKNLDLILDSTITAFINSNDAYTSFIPTVTLNELSAPITKGSIVGSISYNVNGKIYTANLLAGNDVQKSYLFVFVDIGMLITVLILIKLIVSKNKKRKKKSSY